MSECSICCEKFNRSTHRPVNCKTCASKETLACQACAKRYILDKPTDASCMVCKIEWDQDFLCESFTKTFINKELKVHRENYLLEKQMALLPDTQQYAEQLKLLEGLGKQKELLLIKKRKAEQALKEINHNIKMLDNTVRDIRHGETTEQKSEFKFKCPAENCNGFLNDKFHCGICENKICRHCMEIKDEDHECDPEKKATVELLKKDTKPCPKCGQLINKSHGCDQMYCIKCHTAFSWRTGAIERGNVHNPEYYRWMRENGKDIPRDPLDVREDPCGNNMVDYMTLLNTLRFYYPHRDTGTTGRFGRNVILDQSWTIKMINMHRLVYHINAENRIYENEQRYSRDHLQKLRAHYILGRLKKEDFKKKIQMMDKKLNKLQKLNNIWNLLKLVLIEYIGKVTEQRYEIEEGKEIIKNIVIESTKIQRYCNDSFKKVGKMYIMTYPGINTDWIHINNWEAYIKQKEKERLDAVKKSKEVTIIQIE